jgi:hypothetical protein
MAFYMPFFEISYLTKQSSKQQKEFKEMLPFSKVENFLLI